MIAVGVDTHKHEHLARAIDGLGQVLGALTITTSLRGYGELAQWLRTLGDGVVVGIEGAGSYGAGLCEYLVAEGFDVVEVERPRREDRRRGKSDEIDALLAAKKVLAADVGRSIRIAWQRRGVPKASAARVSCPRPEHAESRVKLDDTCGRAGHRRQRYKCLPVDGDKAHVFTKLLPREEA